MSDTGLMVPGMDEPPRRYNLTITMAREGGRLPDPVSFAAAADRAAWRRSASIVSAYTADPIITVVIVHAPSRYAAVAVAGPSYRKRSSTSSPHPARPPAKPAAVRRFHRRQLPELVVACLDAQSWTIG